MQETEGRRLAAVPKQGEPRDQWAQDRPNTLSNSFGVVDAEGKTIKGMHVDLEVFVSPRLGLSKFVFTLWQVESGRKERAYQLHVNCRPGLMLKDHNATHEHFGEPRFSADATWVAMTFNDAVARFCKNANLTLTGPLPDYQEFQLK